MRSAAAGPWLWLWLWPWLCCGAAANGAPRFLINGHAEIVLRLKEGPETPVGSLIYRLRGVDPDGDPLTFGVREQAGRELLRIENLGTNEANVYLEQELDREAKDEYALVLTLTDGNLGDGNFITQSLLLLVEDVNDNEPVFRPYQPTVEVREDSPPGVLATLEATDRDEGPYGQVVYHLQELEGENDLFAISTENGKGVVRLVGQLDYERKFLYQLRVLAVDRANNDRVNTGTAAIVVKVQDVEDQPPEFVVASPVTRVSEDARIGTSVLQVKAVDGDRGINNHIKYFITQGPGKGSFGIDGDTGVVFTTSKLDREDPANSNGAFILEITAQEETEVMFPPPVVKTEVTIIVTDINDEIPTFRSKSYVGEVNENAQANTPITFLDNAIPEVFDHDQGTNGTFTMFIDGDHGIFDVTPHTGINEASFLIRVKNPNKLDYEKISAINFTLIARETVPQNPKYSLVPVTVHIRDMNDNFPEFTDPMYEVTVPENSRTGATVAWVQAHDEDSGDFGTRGIRYTNLGGSVSELLHLDPISGIITTKSKQPVFDRELLSRHYLTVEARDNLGFGNRNTAQLVINVEDVNDNAPQFLKSKYEARLIENKLEFEAPLQVEARDIDLNGTRNSRVRYSIVGGDQRGNFSVDPVTGALQPALPLDFEELAARGGGGSGAAVRPVGLTVEARDHGDPSLASRVGVVVYVHDANDHAPQFEHASYRQSIREDTPGGTSVLQVRAWDGDGSAPNSAVVYRIQSGAQDKFVIDAELGVISVAAGANLDPDRTEPRSFLYRLAVVALDGGVGSEQLQSYADVNISVVDVNNKPPVFVDPGTVRIRENTQVGQHVHRVRAVDPDARPVLKYRLDAGSSEARSEEGTIVKVSDYDYVGAFELHAHTGDLRVMKQLDREKVETVRLGLVVEDVASVKGKQVTKAILTIIVEDENDNNPKFRRPFYRRSVTENSKNGVTVINVVADDADKNRTIKYMLEGSRTIMDLLYLDEETGEVVVASRIDHEVTPWLNFTVRATDSGVPPRASFVEVFVQVLDENDNNPYFVGDVSNITVREDAPPGTEIALIEARDADSGDFGTITYLLDRMSSQGKFQIHPSTGVLNVSDVLNREEQSSYMLIIEAWDNYQFGYASGESRNAFKQIGVNIVDVNDETPVFEPILGCITITEFHELREAVTTIKATDLDDPNTPNGRIVFSIVSGDDLDLFRVENLDYSSARIAAVRPLKGLYGNYTLVVRAQDLGTPPNAATAEVRICVTDFNDNAPRFASPPHNTTIRIPENATIGSTVIQVHATDNDIGPNGAVRYRLRQDLMGNWKTFSIEERTGIVTLRQRLDRAKQKIYEIRVEAYDLGIPTPLSTDLDLTVYIRNVDDYEPQFLVDKMVVNFTEHVPPGVEKRKLVDTVDRDEVDYLDDPPPPVCYFIVGGDGENIFTVEAFRHEITVVQELDREVQGTYELLVKATEDCIHSPTLQDTYDPADSTVLRVLVNVEDINDNPPLFVKKVFTGGVTTEADFGAEFMHIKAVDVDEGENAVVTYYQVGDIQMTSPEGLENVHMPAFLVDRESGAVQLNFDPQKGMKGYFDFMVLANDSAGLEDLARVFIYLLREDQRVKFVLRQHPPEVRERIDVFREVLGNVTGAIVNVDEFKVHENDDASVDKTKTDLYLHFVSQRDHSIMEVSDVLWLIDQNIERLDRLFKDFNVLDTQPAEAQLLKGDSEVMMLTWLAGSTLFLGLLLVLVTSICLSQRLRFQRQLKAATVAAFGSNESDLNHVTGRVPNTNKHSVEGSNPIWLQAYENEWYKEEEDSTSQASERDSLDENAVTNDTTHQTGNGTAFIVRPLGTCNSRSNMRPDAAGLKEQNDLNRSGGLLFHQNLYQHLDKLSNPFIAKKLETTEL
ncbi:cadherin-23 [Bacillus rossius redtenbacheri]|uniref:cadherin-23 n=1 Tax=Bacillus rossius redtenbacheri TaxID=93214 RepID=UPI002FDDD917